MIQGRRVNWPALFRGSAFGELSFDEQADLIVRIAHGLIRSSGHPSIVIPAVSGNLPKLVRDDKPGTSNAAVPSK